MTGPDSRPFTGWLTLTPALVLSLGLGYAVFVGVGRLLEPADFAVFAAFWGLLFGLGGTLAPLEQEAARLVVVHGPGQQLRRRLLEASLVIVLGLVALAAVTGVVVVDQVLHGSWVLFGLAVVAGAGFAVQYVVRGGRLGAGDVRTYSALVLAEAAVRAAVLAGLVAVTAPGLVGCAVAVAVGSFAWVGALGRRHPAAQSTTDPPSVRQMLPKMLGLILAAAFTSASVTGFPALAAAVASTDQRAELGVLLAALTVTRLPLLLLGPLQAFLVPGFTRRLLEQGWGRTWPLLGGILAAVVTAGAVVCAVAWWWGADVVSLLYGDAYRIGDHAVSAMTAGATITAVLLVLAACLVALDRHPWVVASWAACFFGILLALVVPGSGLVPRVVGALIAGPAVGATVAGVGLLRAGSDRRVGSAQPGPG